METPCVYLKQTKMSCFSFSLFLCCKIGEQEGGTGPAQEGELVPVGRRER
jgi:hypothetical protein